MTADPSARRAKQSGACDAGSPASSVDNDGMVTMVGCYGPESEHSAQRSRKIADTRYRRGSITGGSSTLSAICSAGVDMLADRYRTALGRCRLATLSDATLDKLTHGSAFLDVPADGTVMRFGSTDAFICVVVDGLVRTYLSSAAGRQLTVRYSRPGDIVGTTTVFTRQLVNSAVQAITASSVLVLRPDTVRALARSDVALANVLLVDIAERAAAYISALAHTTLSSLRQNVVRHLLDLAMRDADNSHLVVRLSQQELADYAGTVREVVGRILRDLKDEHLVTTGRDEIVLLDPERLHDITWPRVY